MRLTSNLSLPGEPSSVTRARQVLAALLNLIDTDDETRGHLAMLISEACANAVMHADPGSTVDIGIVLTDDECVLEVGNGGSSPDGAGLSAGLPDPLTVGGRGLPLITALSDTAVFAAAPPGRVLLRMTKRLRPGIDGTASPQVAAPCRGIAC